MRRQGCAYFAIGLLAACASTPVAVPGPLPLPAATPASAPAQPPPTPTPPALTFKEALDAATKALALGDMATADKQLDAAERAAGDDAHRAHLLARARATRFVAVGDFESAATAFLAVMPMLARHPELIDEFWAHNTMMMIREAQGDPAAALAENDQATLCAERGTWDPQGRKTLALQKDRWHRAYLTRMLAESRTGTAKQALVRYAEAALDDYRESGFTDSIAVLEAYFAALDGKRDVAAAGAKRVDPAKDDDVEDLYLVVVGLEAGGAHAEAEAVRKKMRQSEGLHIARFIMLRWLDLDAKAPGPDNFTPWHAGAHER
jgi:hypothetical protein